MTQPNKKPMTALDYIKNQPHLQGKPLTTQNQYSALAEFPPLSYSKAVTTEKGQSSTTTQKTQQSQYFKKPQKMHLLTTRHSNPISLKDLTNFTKRIYHENILYPTDNLTKDRTFYEYILVDSESAEITHFPDKTNPNKISYSTCRIKRIASADMLGFINIHTQKSFSNPGYHIQGYTYTDYVNAFFRTFYLRSFDHSWFISFHHLCPKNLPGWFSEWWYWFGAEEDIYPETIIKSSLPLYKKLHPSNCLGPIQQIYFHIDMGVPWICSWNFDLTLLLPKMPYSLVREFRIKWWNKYDLDRCSLSNIQRHHDIHKQVSSAIRVVSSNIPLLTPSQLTKQIRQHQSPPKIAKQSSTSSPKIKQPSPNKPSTPNKHSSPTHSTSSSQKSSKRREKLKALMRQVEQAIVSSDDDDTKTDTASTQDTHDDHRFGGPLAQNPDDEDPINLDDLDDLLAE